MSEGRRAEHLAQPHQRRHRLRRRHRRLLPHRPGGPGKPALWRHGDWFRITRHPASGSSGAIIQGRDDTFINRCSVRMGTADPYRAVEAQPGVLDGLMVDLDCPSRESGMTLFVALARQRPSAPS